MRGTALAFLRRVKAGSVWVVFQKPHADWVKQAQVAQ